MPRATADVVIVGAGYTGLAAALTLARAGRDVIVVDAGVPGFGASTRNGGQVGSGNQKFRVKTLIEMKGERLAVDLLREGVEMLDGIESSDPSGKNRLRLHALRSFPRRHASGPLRSHGTRHGGFRALRGRAIT